MRILQSADPGDMAMTRKQFLKICALAVIGPVLGRISGLFTPKTTPPNGIKEARYYRSPNTLAG